MLAQQANITKQSMGALIDHLSRTGYVERVDDPDDGRASRLRLTARGRAFVEEVRGFARRVEAAWVARVGARRVEELLLADDVEPPGGRARDDPGNEGHVTWSARRAPA